MEEKFQICKEMRKIRFGLKGLLFASYTIIDNPTSTIIDNPTSTIIDNPINNVFSEFNFPSTYKLYLQEKEEKPNPIVESAFNPNIKWKGNNWIDIMRLAYLKAGITNLNMVNQLIAQDALESNWGKSALGKYNYGNITDPSKGNNSVLGNDKDSNGNAIKLYFRNYSSVDDYVNSKLNLLKKRYDFNLDDNIELFTNKLIGNNTSNYKYAEARNYKDSIINLYNSKFKS